MLARIYS